MSAINLFPKREDTKGFIDSWEPFRGWCLATKEIDKMAYITDTTVYPLRYGLHRSDVVATLKKRDTSLTLHANSGFALDAPPPPGGSIILELAGGETVMSRVLTAQDMDQFLLDDAAPYDGPLDHLRWREFLSERFNKEGLDILEIGARRVTDAKGMRPYFDKANFHGIDLAPGADVDVVGDAHLLSIYYNLKFDLILSTSVFEHLAMPWLAALEIIRCLKVGGHVFIETHYSFCSHDRPWHFFQFSDKALEALFPATFGMECIATGVSNPLRARFSALASPYLRERLVSRMYCHSEYFGKKTAEMKDYNWNAATLEAIYHGTAYPHCAERT